MDKEKSTKNKLRKLIVMIDEDTYSEVDRYRYENKMRSKAEVIRKALELLFDGGFENPEWLKEGGL